MHTVKSKEARANWAELLRRAENGETIIIEHYNRPVATIAPYRPPRVRATATTYNGRTGATVSIHGVSMADAADYPDKRPGADGHVADGEWILRDRGERDLRIVEPTLEAAIMTWAQQLGHHLSEIVIDAIYPPGPDDGPDDW